MNASEILKKVKDLFTAPPIAAAAPPAPTEAEPAASANVISYGIEGGQPVFLDVSDDNIVGIDANDKVFSDEALTMPYPDGSYKVTGTNFMFTVSGGVVSVVTDPDGTGAGIPTPDEVEPVTTGLESAPNQPTIDTKITDLENRVDAIKKMVMPAGMAQMVEDQSKIITRHEETIKGLFELVEKLVEMPTADPVTLTGPRKERFEKEKVKDERMKKMAEQIHSQKVLA